MVPGGMRGALLYVAGRLFDRPRLSVCQLVLSTAWIWLAVEICALTSAIIVWRTERGIFPADWYPTHALGLLITQTIQITAYASGAIFSIIFLLWTWRRRRYLKRDTACI